MTIQNFSMVAGNSKTITATIDKSLTNSTLLFRILKNGSVLVQKDNMTVQDSVMTLTLVPSDTQALSGEVDYDIILTDEYGNVTTLFEGTISFDKGKGGVNAQQVFITAMNLMDEETEDGTYNGYPEEYKKKAWNVLTLLQAELTPAWSTPAVITDANSSFFLDDRTCLTVLPYGLAAHLLMNEDQSRAAFFNARYDELKRKRPAKITQIVDVYAAQSEPTTVLTPETPTTPTPVDDGWDLDETWE